MKDSLAIVVDQSLENSFSQALPNEHLFNRDFFMFLVK